MAKQFFGFLTGDGECPLVYRATALRIQLRQVERDVHKYAAYELAKTKGTVKPSGEPDQPNLDVVDLFRSAKTHIRGIEQVTKPYDPSAHMLDPGEAAANAQAPQIVKSAFTRTNSGR